MNWQEHVRNNKKLRTLQFNQLKRPPLLADVRGVPEDVGDYVLLAIQNAIGAAQLIAPAVCLVAGNLEPDLGIDDCHVGTDERRDGGLHHLNRGCTVQVHAAVMVGRAHGDDPVLPSLLQVMACLFYLAGLAFRHFPFVDELDPLSCIYHADQGYLGLCFCHVSYSV